MKDVGKKNNDEFVSTCAIDNLITLQMNLLGSAQTCIASVVITVAMPIIMCVLLLIFIKVYSNVPRL